MELYGAKPRLVQITMLGWAKNTTESKSGYKSGTANSKQWLK